MEPSGRWVELSDGDEFAGYRIERRLGRGGMDLGRRLAREGSLDLAVIQGMSLLCGPKTPWEARTTRV